MLDRMWWFVTGAIAGGWVTVRALRRRPTAIEWKDAAAATAVDITFATDNFRAGQLIGQWAAGQLDGEKATIAMLEQLAGPALAA